MTTPMNAFEAKVSAVFSRLKTGGSPENWIPVFEQGVAVANLRPLATGGYTEADIALLTQWRIENQHWFPTQFNVTHEGTKVWLDRQVIGKPDRILFMIQDMEGVAVGHVGLCSFNYTELTCEMDNVIRGRNDVLPNGMVLAYKTLAEWAMNELGAQEIFARLFADNRHSVLLQLAAGFRRHRKIPMRKLEKDGAVHWVEMEAGSGEEPERYFLVAARSRRTL